MIIQCFFSILNDYLMFSMTLDNYQGPRGPGTTGDDPTGDEVLEVLARSRVPEVPGP